MKLLEEIPTFPEGPRLTLEREYGIDSAEAFYVTAVKRPEGIQEALSVDREELERLRAMVEAYLSPGYIERCHQPVERHPRGAAIPAWAKVPREALRTQ